MQQSDILSTLLGAIILGGFIFAVLAYSLSASKRSTVIKWCFLAGGTGIIIYSLCAAFNVKPPAKIVIGLTFIAFPAFICGLLLQLQNSISKWKSATKPNPSSKQDS